MLLVEVVDELLLGLLLLEVVEELELLVVEVWWE